MKFRNMSRDDIIVFIRVRDVLKECFPSNKDIIGVYFFLNRLCMALESTRMDHWLWWRASDNV